ncbi:MAG: hypothetical protein ACQESH_09490, partial [Campylobacterota bacterium]
FDTDAAQLDASKLAQDKLNVFYCNTGMTSTDAYNSLSKEDKQKALYLDATVECEGTDCEVEANQDLSDLL